MLIESGSSMSAAVAAIAEEFDGDPDAIAADVDQLVTELAAQGLVVTGEPPGATTARE
jgi:hypothetical protein